MEAVISDHTFEYEGLKTWTQVRSFNFSVKKLTGIKSSTHFLLDQDETIKKLLALKDGDKILLKEKKYKVDDGWVVIKQPIEIILAFKVKGYETFESWLETGYFLSSIDCECRIKTPVYGEQDDS